MNRYSTLFFSIFLLLCLGIASSSCNRSEMYNSPGKVVRIIDGDTYEILLDGNVSERIRMEGIDAPEKGMPYYKASKQYLSDLCFGEHVQLLVTTKDRYGRTVAYAYLPDGRELSQEMLKAGMAWHFKRHNTNDTLSALELQARKQGIGLWKDPKPMAPWDNRSYHRKGISTKDSFDLREGNR